MRGRRARLPIPALRRFRACCGARALPSMFAVMLARESLPAGLKYSPARIEPAIETVGFVGFSKTSNVTPFESWKRFVRSTKELFFIDFIITTNAFFLLGYEPSDGAVVFGERSHDA